jgi:hypothetical protein
MIFLIDYDRGRGQIVSLSSFPDSERRIAEESRLAIELTLNQSVGSRRALAAAVRTVGAGRRHTALAARLMPR